MQYVHELLVYEFDLPNAIKGMEAKAPITATVESHRIGRTKERSSESTM